MSLLLKIWLPLFPVISLTIERGLIEFGPTTRAVNRAGAGRWKRGVPEESWVEL